MKTIIQICVSVIFLVGACVEALSATPPAATAPNASVQAVCARIYGDKTASCVPVPCNALYRSFLGTWKGEFRAYDRKHSTQGKAVYRPYREQVTYTQSDCLKNAGTGEVFIVGHQTDRYPVFGDAPAKTETSLLVTGRKRDGTPYLRYVSEQGNYSYAQTYHNEAAGLSVWTLHIPAAGDNPEMTFTTIDGRDLYAKGKDTRDVTVTLRVGPSATPYWQGVIAYGTHTRQ